MSATHARGQGGKPHRYYVSRPALAGQPAATGSIARVPAREIETLVIDQMSDAAHPPSWEEVRCMLQRIEVSSSEVRIFFHADALDDAWRARLADRPNFSKNEAMLRIPARFGARSGAVRLLDANGRAMTGRPAVNQALVRAIARGWRWCQLLLRGVYASSTDLAEREGVTRATVRRFVNLAYLSPELIRELLDGRQRPGLSLDRLVTLDLPRDWDAQERLLARVTAA